MDIKDLRTSCSDMSDEELINTLKDIRLSRRTVKKQPATTTQKKAKTPKQEASGISVAELIAKMSPTQIAEALAKAKGGKGNG